MPEKGGKIVRPKLAEEDRRILVGLLAGRVSDILSFHNPNHLLRNRYAYRTAKLLMRLLWAHLGRPALYDMAFPKTRTAWGKILKEAREFAAGVVEEEVK